MRASPRERSVTYRDLPNAEIPQITDGWLGTFGDPSSLTDSQREYLSFSDRLIDELVAADVIVIGSPMYNLTISAPLKAWLDQVVRVGKTVSYGAHGPEGLLKGKKVWIVTARGGSYSGEGSHAANDFQEPYLRAILSFIGITDVSFIRADAQLNPEKSGESVAAAIETIRQAASSE